MRAASLLPFLTCALAAQGKIDFQRQILPIFEKSCVECHASPHTGPDGKLKKPKAGVVLDSKDGITGKKGLVVAKNPAGSSLYAAITLPADDEDRMPPQKKGEPLPKAQTDLIAQWIEEGASFGTWTGKKAEAPAAPVAGKGNVGKAKVDPLPKLAEGVKPLPAATLAAFAEGPFLVSSVGDGSPLLAVGCRGNADAVDDRAIARLAPLATHIAELELARTRLGDEGCKVIATMPRLVSLDVRQSTVGNHGVAALAACKELRSLNLFGTKAGDYGIAALSALKNLEQLYVWQTEVSAEAIVRLRDGIPGLRVVMGVELPEPMPEGTGGGRRRR